MSPMPWFLDGQGSDQKQGSRAKLVENPEVGIELIDRALEYP